MLSCLDDWLLPNQIFNFFEIGCHSIHIHKYKKIIHSSQNPLREYEMIFCDNSVNDVKIQIQ